MNKKIRIWIIVLACLLISVLGIKFKMDNDAKILHEEMVKVVKSKEVEELFIQGFKNSDSEAFTRNGVIKSFEVDLKSLKHNPMGGIIGKIVVNNDPRLYAHFDIDKNDENGELIGGLSGNSVELEDLLGGKNE